ncbi:hypothetical protein GQ43DRAFT_125283 [Delitschia confertaspora ATCC 74209]|uniref:PHD-type domain-containing protein n=1 Tax=Delitschia confertaspora ATCC 74209 TaxID=1513339 RepID=A0A9P4JHH8_9PLEO|nr:hypothetical protein GQ43DRAFT_125283 [Delitschia confertaspora ATCC 74209]
MVSRKRAREEMETEEFPQEHSTLDKLRNMWEFANLMQYIALFGDVVKIDREFDIQELESECLKPQPSEMLAQIGLAFLKQVSSHKGLNLEIFDEYTRRQYVAKAPQRNPFGTGEAPHKFNDFDIFTKIRVLQQLSTWTLYNPNYIRERMAATEAEQALWRMEPLGWDSQDRTLFVLDDNRLYRRTDPPPPSPPAKAKSKAPKPKSRGTRNSKRRKVDTPEPDPVEEAEVSVQEENGVQDNGFGGMKWECLCITLEEYQEFLNGIRKSKDPNEKELYKRLEEDVLPAIKEVAEEQSRKEARKLKELEVLQKLATAKRSSRISAKMEKQKELEEAAEAERKRQADLAMAKAEQEKQRRMEEARESRMMTREQRLKEREVKRILHEEELKRLKENSEKLGNTEGRLSERYLKAEMKRRQHELQKLNQEEDWFFDCSVCGLHGENLDDGSHSIQCEKCKVWQHSKCHNIEVAQAERDDFHFICKDCKRREEEAKMPKLPPLKFRLASISPKAQTTQEPSASDAANSNGAAQSSAPSSSATVQAGALPAVVPQTEAAPHIQQPLLNGPSLSPRGQADGPPGSAYGAPIEQSNGSSPSRPYSTGHRTSISATNGFLPSSPLQYQTPRVAPVPHNNINLSFPRPNGSPYGAFRPTPNGSFTNFGQPGSAASPNGPYHSPVKHSPAPSPQQIRVVSAAQAFPNSPNSSFPPPPSQEPVLSPEKHSSPPPLPMSSPVPMPAQLDSSPMRSSANILPDPMTGLSPEKHDGVRPVSSHVMSETPIFPPSKALSPNASPQVMHPPVKKMSPTPEKPRAEGAGQFL